MGVGIAIRTSSGGVMEKQTDREGGGGEWSSPFSKENKRKEEEPCLLWAIDIFRGFSKEREGGG